MCTNSLHVILYLRFYTHTNTSRQQPEWETNVTSRFFRCYSPTSCFWISFVSIICHSSEKDELQQKLERMGSWYVYISFLLYNCNVLNVHHYNTNTEVNNNQDSAFPSTHTGIGQIAAASRGFSSALRDVVNTSILGIYLHLHTFFPFYLHTCTLHSLDIPQLSCLISNFVFLWFTEKLTFTTQLRNSNNNNMMASLLFTSKNQISVSFIWRSEGLKAQGFPEELECIGNWLILKSSIVFFSVVHDCLCVWY